jgi:hypothetical protein
MREEEHERSENRSDGSAVHDVRDGVMAPGGGRSAGRPWTVMVYIDADNNLEEYGVMNLHQHLVLDDDWHIMLL